MRGFSCVQIGRTIAEPCNRCHDPRGCWRKARPEDPIIRAMVDFLSGIGRGKAAR